MKVLQQFLKIWHPNHLPNRLFSISNILSGQIQSQGYLSPNYNINNVWEKRLETPILEKVHVEDFFFEVDKRYQTDQTITAIDVDLFTNKVTEPEYADELGELLHRLRKSSATAGTLPSTSHAYIRAMLAFDKTNNLMNVLNDRINYGVFVDSFTANLLMDHFLKVQNYRDAAKVGSLLMLEEDFGPPTTKFFSLLSCVKYIENKETALEWETYKYPETKGKEETKIRVDYLRHPSFDDHFELDEPRHIVGKTIWQLHFQLSEDPILKLSCKLLGLTLWDKWDLVEETLKEILQKKLTVSSDLIVKLKQIIEEREKEIEASPDKCLPKPKIKRVPGMNLEKDRVAEAYERGHFPDFGKNIASIKESLASPNFKLAKWSLAERAEEELKIAISKCEKEEMDKQAQAYEEWTGIRQQRLALELKKVRDLKTLRENRKKVKELEEREDTIFFFDNEEKWMMRQPPEVRVYQMRWRGRYKAPKVKEDETYIPPHI